MGVTVPLLFSGSRPALRAFTFLLVRGIMVFSLTVLGV